MCSVILFYLVLIPLSHPSESCTCFLLKPWSQSWNYDFVWLPTNVIMYKSKPVTILWIFTDHPSDWNSFTVMTKSTENCRFIDPSSAESILKIVHIKLLYFHAKLLRARHAKLSSLFWYVCTLVLAHSLFYSSEHVIESLSYFQCVSECVYLCWLCVKLLWFMPSIRRDHHVTVTCDQYAI